MAFSQNKIAVQAIIMISSLNDNLIILVKSGTQILPNVQKQLGPRKEICQKWRSGCLHIMEWRGQQNICHLIYESEQNCWQQADAYIYQLCLPLLISDKTYTPYMRRVVVIMTFLFHIISLYKSKIQNQAIGDSRTSIMQNRKQCQQLGTV